MYHLAQVNIGLLLAPLNDPQIAGFAAEGKERLDHLKAHGEMPDAFSFKRPFASPDAAAAALEGIRASCS